MKRLRRYIGFFARSFREASEFERRLKEIGKAFDDGARAVIRGGDDYEHFPEIQRRIERAKRRVRLRRIARDCFYYSIWIGVPLAFCAAVGYLLARMAP